MPRGNYAACTVHSLHCVFFVMFYKIIFYRVLEKSGSVGWVHRSGWGLAAGLLVCLFCFCLLFLGLEICYLIVGVTGFFFFFSTLSFDIFTGEI
jgi:hypothetical protein